MPPPPPDFNPVYHAAILAPGDITSYAERPEYCRRRNRCLSAGDKGGLIPIGAPYQAITDGADNILIVCPACHDHYKGKEGSKYVATEIRPSSAASTQSRPAFSARQVVLTTPALQPSIGVLRRMNQQAKMRVGGSHVRGIGASIGSTNTGLAARGYTPAHRHYTAEVQRRGTQAYARLQPQTYFVKFAVHYLELGKQGSRLFMNLEDKHSLPARSTPTEIKTALYGLMQRRLMESTRGFIFNSQDFELRGKDMTSYDRFPPEKPLFYDQCFVPPRGKAKGSTPEFRQGKTFDVRLVMSALKYEEVERYMEMNPVHPSRFNTQVAPTASPERSLFLPRSQSFLPENDCAAYDEDQSFQAFRTEQGVPTQSAALADRLTEHRAPPHLPEVSQRVTQMSSAPTSSTAGRRQDFVSPDPAAILNALKQSNALIGSAKLPSGSFRDTGLFISAPVLNFRTLVQDAYRLVIDWPKHGCTAELHVDERLESLLGRPGSFKTAHPGSLVLHESADNGVNLAQWPFAAGQRTPVALKRWFQKASENDTDIVRIGRPEEEGKLAAELTCMIWASSLLNMVYDCIAAARSVASPTDPVMGVQWPSARYVHAGLFRVTQPATKSKQKSRNGVTYLVEELIRHGTTETPGKFVKYINNSHAAPLLTTGCDGDLARFLSFAQHLQYINTDGLVYVSDFQGHGGLLTDPQILTHPSLVGLFGGGNVARAFKLFTTEHVCTEYCIAFGIENHWPARSITAASDA